MQGKVTGGEIFFHPVTPYSVKNFTGMVIGIEKINRSFGSQWRSARLHVAWQHRFVASDNGQKKKNAPNRFESKFYGGIL